MRRLIFFETLRAKGLQDGDQVWGNPYPYGGHEYDVAVKVRDFVLDKNGCGLSSRQLQVLTLVYCGERFFEIAKKLGICQQVVRKRYLKALDNIRKYFLQNPEKAQEMGVFGRL